MSKRTYYSWLFFDNKLIRFFLIFDFLNLIRKYNQKKLIRILKSFNHLKSQNKLNYLDEIENEIENIKLTSDKIIFQKIYNGINIEINNNILQQFLNKFLSKKFGIISISRSLLLAKYKKTKLIYPYPREVLEVINKKIKVNFLLSSLLLFGVKLLFFCYGLKTLLEIILNYFLNFSIRQKYSKNSFYFFNISDENLNNPNGYSVFNWYKKIARNENIDNFYHNNFKYNKIQLEEINIEFKNLYLIENFSSLIKLVYWSLFYVPLYFLLTIFGKWYYPLIFNEIILAKKFQYSKNLSNKYFFNNSNYIYRPLWTYIVERQKSEIIFYFYSNNIDRIVTNNKLQFPPRYWLNTSWNKYYIWDEYNKFFLDKFTTNKKIYKNTGPIWFGDKKNKISKYHKKFITVFDVSPSRPLFYKSLFFSDNYNLFENSKRFIDDIYKICKKYEIYIYFKQKRTFTNIHDRRYINLIKNYSNKKYFVSLDPSISVFSLIKSSNGIISFPFTSTNIIANNFNKLSIYYDPSKKIKLQKNISHGLKLVNGLDDLENWIKKINFK